MLVVLLNKTELVELDDKLEDSVVGLVVVLVVVLAFAMTASVEVKETIIFLLTQHNTNVSQYISLRLYK